MKHFMLSLALTVLALAATIGSAAAQEPAQNCASLPGGSQGKPGMIVTDNGPNFNLTVWTVQGCRFEPNQSVSLEGTLKLGDAAPRTLDKLSLTTDANGEFKAEFRYDGQPSDFNAGYEFRVVANGAGATNESAGSVGIPGGGVPQVPSTGAGGSTGTSNLFLIAALSAIAAAALALAARRAVH